VSVNTTNVFKNRLDKLWEAGSRDYLWF